MKLIGLIALAALVFASCSKPVGTSTAPPIVTPVTPAALATPHPAAAAKERAMRLYPELAKKDSPFNLAFRTLYDLRRKNDPDALTKEDWPLTLAHKAASLVGAKVIATATPKPPAPAPGNSSRLSEKTYNQRKAFAETDGDGRALDFNRSGR